MTTRTTLGAIVRSGFVALLLALLPGAVPSVQAGPDTAILRFAIFGAGDAANTDTTSTGNGTRVFDGLVGGNRTVVLGGGGGSDDHYTGVRAGLDLGSGGNNTTIGLDGVIANNHVTLGPSGTVRGHVDAQSATLQNNAKILGTLTLPAGVSPTLGTGAVVTTLVNSGSPPPRTFAKITELPGPSVYAASTDPAHDVTVTAGSASAAPVLPPGIYRNLSFDGNGKHLKLTAGTYVFDTIAITGSNSIHVDATAGDVLIFAAGGVTAGNTNKMLLTGSPKGVYLESRGTVALGGSNEWFGTIYSTKSDAPGAAGISAGSSNVIVGSLYSRQQVQIGGANTIRLEVSDYFQAFFLQDPPLKPPHPVLAFAVFGAGTGASTDATTFGNNTRVFGGLVGSNRSLIIGGGGGSSDHFLGIRAGTGMGNSGNGSNVGPEGIVANGHVEIPGSGSVSGDVDAATARLKNNAAILGTLTLPPGVSPILGPGASVGTLVNGAPLAFTAIVMPPPSSYSASTSPAADVVVDAPNATAAPVLPPGVYRDLVFSGNTRHLKVEAGTYVFRTVTITGSNHIHVDVTQGEVTILVEGDVSMGSSNRVYVYGGSARDIYLETAGTFAMGGGNTWHGTVFSTKSDTPGQAGIAVGNSSELAGALYSNQQVQVGGGVRINREVASAFERKANTP